jgi:hypothetical protein
MMDAADDGPGGGGVLPQPHSKAAAIYDELTTTLLLHRSLLHASISGGAVSAAGSDTECAAVQEVQLQEGQVPQAVLRLLCSRWVLICLASLQHTILRATQLILHYQGSDRSIFKQAALACGRAAGVLVHTMH